MTDEPNTLAADAPSRATHPTLAAALIAAKAQFGKALKSTDGQYGKHVTFADVDAAVNAALLNNGLTYVQPPQLSDKPGVTVKTVLIHESGTEMDCGTLFIPSGKVDAHGFGSALTYARRFGLEAALGIAREDDDGKGAMQQGKNKRQQSELGAPGTMPSAAKVENMAKRLWVTARQRGAGAAEAAYRGFSPAEREALHDTLAEIQAQAASGEVAK